MYSRVKGDYGDNVTVEELNEDLFRLHIPALIFVALCIVTGFVGNLLVLFVYKKRFRRSNHRYFILFLAALDFSACITGMPFLVASLRLPYLMTSSAFCKSMRYLHYLVNNSSGLLLLVISVERYRKICHPFKTQLTTKQTLYLCYGTVFFSAIIAIPSGVLYGASTIETGVGNITGYQCYVDDNLEHKILFEIYQGILMIETILSIVVFIILYAFIIRKLWKSDQFIEAMRSMQIRNKSVQETSFSTDCDRDAEGYDSTYSSFPNIQTGSRDAEEPLANNGACARRINDSEIVEQSVSSQSINTGNGVNDIESRGKAKSLWRMSRELFKLRDHSSGKPELSRAVSDTRLNRVKNTNKFTTLTPAERQAMQKLLKPKQQPVETHKQPKSKNMKSTARVTLMLFTVSMVFAVSFVPHLTLMIVTAEKEDFLDSMNEQEIMVYQIFLRSFILNNVANPIVYLFCDSKFRKLCKEFLRKCILCNRNKK